MPPIPSADTNGDTIKTVRTFHGDCLSIMPTIETESVDAVITDPPYGIDYQSARRIDKDLLKPKIENDKQPFIWWLHEAARVMSDGGALLCFCRWDVAEAFRLAIGWAGLNMRGQIVWDRIAHGMGDTAGSPAPQHDLIWYATKGRRVFEGTRPRSIVRATRLDAESLQHPNEKPVYLMANLVRSYAAFDGVCLDPFMGVGTTGVACVQTGRRFIGVELDRGYYDIAERRIAAEQMKLSAPRLQADL